MLRCKRATDFSSTYFILSVKRENDQVLFFSSTFPLSLVRTLRNHCYTFNRWSRIISIVVSSNEKFSPRVEFVLCLWFPSVPSVFLSFLSGFYICSVSSLRPSEVRLCKKTVLRNAGTNGCSDAVSQKPPLGLRGTSTPPLGPPGAVLVQRSQVCLSNFYKECAESADSEPDCSCQPAERDGRSVGTGGRAHLDALD